MRATLAFALVERASRILSRSRNFSDPQQTEQLARAAWSAAVGKRLADKPFRLRLFGNKLVVEVEDAVWQKQLTTLGGMILARMNEVLGRELVKELEFRVGAPRVPVKREEAPVTGVRDESDAIADPVLRHLYLTARRKKQA